MSSQKDKITFVFSPVYLPYVNVIIKLVKEPGKEEKYFSPEESTGKQDRPVSAFLGADLLARKDQERPNERQWPKCHNGQVTKNHSQKVEDDGKHSQGSH